MFANVGKLDLSKLERISLKKVFRGPLVAFLLGLILVGIGLEVVVRWSGSRGRAQVKIAIDESARWRILCVGHSHTMGFGAPPSESFPAQLERRLRAKNRNVQVFNLGFGGWNTAQILKELPVWLSQYQPHVVLIWAGDPNFYNSVGLHRQAESHAWDPRQSLRSLNFLSLLWNGVGTSAAIGREEYDPPWGTGLGPDERALAWAGQIEVGPADPLRYGEVLNREIEKDLKFALARNADHPLLTSSYVFFEITRSPGSTLPLAETIERYLVRSTAQRPSSLLMARALVEYAQRKAGEIGKAESVLFWQSYKRKLQASASNSSWRPAREAMTSAQNWNLFRDGDLISWLIDRRVPQGLSRAEVQQQYSRIIEEVPTTPLIAHGPMVVDPRFNSPFDFLPSRSEAGANQRLDGRRDLWSEMHRIQLRLIELNPYSASFMPGPLYRAIAADPRAKKDALRTAEILRQSAPEFARTLTFDDDWVAQSVFDGLSQMIRLSKAAGARPYLQLYHPLRLDFPQELRTNTIIRDVAEQSGVRSIDPLPWLQKSIGKSSYDIVFTKEFGPYDNHLNELGYKAIAESVEQALAADGVFE